MSSPEHKKLIWNLIKSVKVGMLTTTDDGDLRGRPMHIVQDDYDGTLWFFTRKDSSKVFEATPARSVCVTFASPSDDVYVSLSGTARLSTDRGLIEKFWGPFAGAWFPNGKDDPNVALLEVKVEKGEHWKTDKNKVLQLVEVAKANLTDTTPDMGKNQKFG